MRKCQLNVEASEAVYTQCKPLVKSKECYNNVFHIVTEYISKFRAGEWRTAYGYMTVFENLLCRHCFIIDASGTAIDPTIFASSAITEREYYAMKVFNDIDLYFKAIEAENFYPALSRYLIEENKRAHEWAAKSGFILSG